jgi:hypothetical protein
MNLTASEASMGSLEKLLIFRVSKWKLDTDPMKSLQKQVLILNLITRVLGVQDASIEVKQDSLMKVLS